MPKATYFHRYLGLSVKEQEDSVTHRGRVAQGAGGMDDKVSMAFTSDELAMDSFKDLVWLPLMQRLQWRTQRTLRGSCTSHLGRVAAAQVGSWTLCYVYVSHLSLACGNASDYVSLVVGMLVPAGVLMDGHRRAGQVRERRRSSIKGRLARVASR